MRIGKVLLLGVSIFAAGSVPAAASEADALAIDANIRAKHMPFGTILDPIYASSTSNTIVGYTRCGDSALWTGAYLAAESFRYKVTQSADALANVRAAFAGLKRLSDLTGDNRLARCAVPNDSPFAAGIAREEVNNSIHQNSPWFWVDNTSRDQVVGAFFGLCAAYDLVDDAALRAGISDLVTLLVGYISRHQWSPNDDITSTFVVRPEELQMLVQVAHHVNPSSTVSAPFYTPPVSFGVNVDVLGLGSYFKFNLAYMTFFHLVRLQNSGSNRDAYQTIRDFTYWHENALFDIVDRALGLPDARRDAQIRNQLNQLLQKPRRDFYVDLSKTVAVCADGACRPIPVPLRTPTDFLWQRDPFQLSGGGSGLIESSGIDYILPYWMARYYGVIGPDTTVVSSAAPIAAVAPNELASLYGNGLAAGTAQATIQPLPVSLAGVRATVTDSLGTQRNAPLSFVSQSQINLLIPEGTVGGAATVRVGPQSFAATVQSVAPALYSMNGTGTGVAAATAIRTQVSNPQLQAPVAVFQCVAAGCSPVPIQLGADTPVYLTLYGTGIRSRSSLSKVTVTIAGMPVPVLYAGPTSGYDGLDQVNVLATLNLRGAGESNVLLTVDGQLSNAVRVSIQ